MTDEKQHTQVPADIVKLIFEQTQKSVETNTLAIKDLTLAVNDLIRAITSSPSHKDITECIKNMETKTHEFRKDICDKQDRENEKRYNEQNKILYKISDMVKELKTKTMTMITIVLITFSLMTVSYIFVNNAINHSVNKNIKAAVEESINKDKDKYNNYYYNYK